MDTDTGLTLLLGAGASVEARVPTAKEMAREIYKKLRANPLVARAMEVAVAGIHFRRSAIEAEPFGEVDVEDLYDVLSALATRNSNILSPFIGSWNQAVTSAEAEGIRENIDHATEQLRVGVQETLRSRPKSSDVDFRVFGNALHDAFRAISGGSAHGAFESAREMVRQELIRICWIRDVAYIEYLRPLIASSKTSPLWIASLNYDNTIELAANAENVQLDLGIRPVSTAATTGSVIHFNDQSPACLAKLHGSISWRYHAGRVEALARPSLEAAMIFGGRSKLRVDGPYLDLLFAFRSRLERTAILNVCGYSFRDTHINHLILNWLDSDTARLLRVVDPYLGLEQIASNVRASLAEGRTSINDAALTKRIQLTNEPAAEWFKHLS